MPSHKSVCEFLISLYRQKHEKWIEFSIRDAKNVGRSLGVSWIISDPAHFDLNFINTKTFSFVKNCVIHIRVVFRRQRKKAEFKATSCWDTFACFKCGHHHLRSMFGCFRGPGNLFASNLNWSRVFKKNVNGFYRQFWVLNAALKFSPLTPGIKQ